MKKLRLIIFFFFLFVMSACQQKKNKIVKGFYCWKTGFSFTPAGVQRLSALQVQKLYVRFFDVKVENGHPVPAGKISVGNKPPASVSIVPVVFITNASLEIISGGFVDLLAANIASLVDNTAAVNQITYTELQVDCDWTLSTKEKYFALLKKLKTRLPGKQLSCTIRLHQVKYYRKTGIPPVDRGMLMFYNMGSLQSTTSNSIFNETDAKKYTASINGYPLPLDAALPVFGWVKHFRQNKVAGLMNQLTEKELKNESSFALQGPHQYLVTKDMFYRGDYLQQNDLLVAEEITPGLAIDAAGLLKKYFKSTNCTVALYHWDSLNLSRYDNEQITRIYGTAR